MLEEEALDQPAQLVIWVRDGEGDAEVKSSHFSRLRDAIAAAASSIGQASVQPWVVTEDGNLLSPLWLKSQIPAS